MQSPQNSAVMFDFTFVEPAFFRLDASPLYGEAVTIVTERLRNIKILFISLVVPAGAAARRYFAVACRLCPVVIFYSALYLVRSGRGTPLKAWGEFPFGHRLILPRQ